MLTFHRLLLAAVIVLTVCGSARAQNANVLDTTCGGAWQGPCKEWKECVWDFWFFCLGDWVIRQPFNGCDSSRFNSWVVLCAPCGATSQSECLLPPRCDDWHYPLGLCYACGGTAESTCWSSPWCKPGLEPNVWGFCYPVPPSEPITNVSGLPSLVQAGSGRDPVRGMADVHNHQFANLGFGGVIFWGEPFDERGIGSALAPCDYTWDFSTHLNAGLLGWVPLWTPFGWEVHGPENLQFESAPVSAYDREGIHDVSGASAFAGWPKYNTMTHQQMYYKWLERAYQGGLRLMVMHAISSEAICKATKLRYGWTCDDMEAVDRQLQAVRDLESYIDRRDDNIENQSGWYRVARSPQEARDFIRAGKMAVVLGIEVDSLFGCKWGSTDCSIEKVRSQLEKYHDAGVRHIYPIHHYDNAFGGSAIFSNMLNTGNALIAGHHFVARNCWDEGYRFNIGRDVFAILAPLLGVLPPDYSRYDELPADCNALGLSTLGREVIEEMMSQKFIIDVDHMSQLMLESVLDMAYSRPSQYPLVSGHTNFPTLMDEPIEMSLDDTQLAKMKAIGGMVTTPTISGDCKTSRDFLSKVRYAINKMAGGPLNQPGETGFEGVALGTDFNGWGGQVQPRFGLADRCPTPAGNPPRLEYPFTGLFGGSFYRMSTGSREFDLNNDGLAHVGLLPDLIADTKLQGLTEGELNVLMNSAEAYIRMWEKVDSSDKAPSATINQHVEGILSDSGWYTSDVTVTWIVTTSNPETNPVTSTSGCERQTITADTAGLPITCTASTGSGTSMTTTSRTVTIKRDTTPPATMATSSVPPGTWTSGNITVHLAASDETSGMLDESAVDILLGTEGVNQTVSHTFRDLAGNTAVASVAGLNIDRTPPRIRFDFADLPPEATNEAKLAEVQAWHNHDVRLIVAASDPLSGVAPGSPVPAQLVLTAEGSGSRGTATATDVAGNSITVESFAVKIDRTPPGIAFLSRAPGANEHGWNNAAVTVRWGCTDALAGVDVPEVSAIVSVEGANLSATGTCTDAAGNTASATHGGINIDMAPPAIQSAAAPLPNAAGWNNTPVTITFTATDQLSDVDGDAVINVPIAVQGTNLSATRTFTDRAGNSASATAGGINIDWTPPSVACAATPSSLWPPNHALVPIAIGLSIDGGLSGNAGHVLVAATSSEPENGLGDGDTAPDIVGFAAGSGVLRGALRAERSGQGPGRVYTLSYRGSDVAGNSSACVATVAVPRDQGSKSR